MTSSSGPSPSESRPRSAGWNVTTPKSRLPCATSTPTWRDGNAPHVDLNLRMRVAEAVDERQQRVHRAFVRADEHAAAAQVAQLADGLLGFFREAHQPLRVVAQHAAGLGQRALLRRSVEQPLAELVLEPPDGLADGRLGPMQLGRGPRKAALGRDGQKDLQFSRAPRCPQKRRS